MSRRTRTAALLSAATLLAGGTLALGLAPAASAAAGDPDLGQLTFSPAAPQAGGALVVQGGGCVPNLVPSTNADPNAATPAAAPALGSVVVTVNGPESYSSGASVQTSADGSWASNSEGTVITLGGAGDYTISASCQLAGVGIYNYTPQDFTIADTTPPPATPSVVVNPNQNVAPGTTVTVAGTGFNGAGGVTVSLQGYSNQTARVDNDGGFAGVSFVIQADQATGTLNGTVTANGGGIAAQDFTVAVQAPSQPGGTADGPVPGGSGGTGGSTAGTTSGGFDSTGSTYGGGSPSYTSTKPTLPNTGADSLWPGVVGGLLVLSGAGLLWIGRRRGDQATGVTAA